MYRNLISPKFTLILCLIFAIGLINTFSHIKYYDNLSLFADNNAQISAKVLTIPSNSDKNQTKFYAKVFSAEIDGEEVNNINSKTIITINDSEENYSKIKIGDTIKIRGLLKIPETSRNPSQFDYAKYLQYKNTFSVFYADREWQITKHADDLPGKILSKLNDTRTHLLKLHAQNIKSPMIEILGGIIFGDDAVSPDNVTKKSFINSGIFHILAASGMNVTLIFGIWFFFARNLRLGYRFSILSGILLILFYTCMTGFGPPIIRASLMLTLILTGKLINRKTSTISLLFIVGFLMLLYSPLMIFDIGFQLSFIVTFALILTAPLLSFNFKHKIFNYILGSCFIPIIAQVFAAPLQMYYFNTFTMYSVFANIAIIPVLSIVSFIGFISSIIALIPLLSAKICFIADIILNPLLIYIVKAANFFSSLPNAIIYVKKPALFQVLLYFAIIVFIIVLLRLNLKAKKYKYILFSAIFIFLLTFLPIKNDNPEVIFFSVGNADASLIKSPHNKYFLIDSGKMPYKTASSQAQNIIIKYLREKGINEIDSYIMTHFDADHAGGTIDLVRNLKIKNIFIVDDYEDTNLSEKITNFFNENNIKPTVTNKEQKIYEENNFTIHITKAKGEKIKTENQKSIITAVKSGNKTILFMGDGDTETYNELPDNFKENVVLLKSGHHGAKNTINYDMLKNAKLTVISTGRNFYNHPDIETINILEDSNKPYLRTDRQNAIKVVFTNNDLKKYGFSPKYKKFIRL